MKAPDRAMPWVGAPIDDVEANPLLRSAVRRDEYAHGTMSPLIASLDAGGSLSSSVSQADSSTPSEAAHQTRPPGGSAATLSRMLWLLVLIVVRRACQHLAARHPALGTAHASAMPPLD